MYGSTSLLVGLFAALLFFGCGDDASGSCASEGGTICTGCGPLGDCSIDCAPGEEEACVGLEFFDGENPDDLRCAFCLRE